MISDRDRKWGQIENTSPDVSVPEDSLVRMQKLCNKVITVKTNLFSSLIFCSSLLVYHVVKTRFKPHNLNVLLL